MGSSLGVRHPPHPESTCSTPIAIFLHPLWVCVIHFITMFVERIFALITVCGVCLFFVILHTPKHIRSSKTIRKYRFVTCQGSNAHVTACRVGLQFVLKSARKMLQCKAKRKSNDNRYGNGTKDREKKHEPSKNKKKGSIRKSSTLAAGAPRAAGKAGWMKWVSVELAESLQLVPIDRPNEARLRSSRKTRHHPAMGLCSRRWPSDRGEGKMLCILSN